MAPTRTYSGSCHCGAVRFEVEAPAEAVVYECNCSICARSGYLHLIVPTADFRLLCGAENLTTYTFNTGVAQHNFCRTCGIKSFYVPRSDPDGFSVNFRCLDGYASVKARIVPFDGQHWEDAMNGQALLNSGSE